MARIPPFHSHRHYMNLSSNLFHNQMIFLFMQVSTDHASAVNTILYEIDL